MLIIFMSYLLRLKNNHKGITLIMTLTAMGILLFLGVYFMSFSLTDQKIARSHAHAVASYYLAEAGLHEMIFKLKNDDAYRIPFETNPSWSTVFTRDNVFGTNESYSISAQNNLLAHAVLSATSSIALADNNTAQRVTQTNVFKALGQSQIEDSAGYADGNIDITASKVNFINGSAHSNNIFKMSWWSKVNIDQELKAVGNLITILFPNITVNNGVAVSGCNPTTHVHAHNCPPQAESIAMPAIDFDSEDSNSYKNLAIAVGTFYTSAAFDTLMANTQNLTLNNAVTYVDGDINVYGAQTLTINGALVAGRDFTAGKERCRGLRCGNNNITVNHTVGQGSGILAKRKISFNYYNNDINLNGVVYATAEFEIKDIGSYVFNITGGLIGQKIDIINISNNAINITHDNQILVDTLNSTTFSPVINIEHWEEEY